MLVDAFKGSFIDIARANRFRVVLSRLGATMEFMCKGTEVPAHTIEAMDVNYQGRIVKVPGDRTYADWSVTVYGENTMSIYNSCQDWLELINGAASNISLPPAAVKDSAMVQLLDRTGVPIKTIDMVGVFPTELGALSLDWSSNSTPLEFPITFAFDYIKS